MDAGIDAILWPLDRALEHTIRRRQWEDELVLQRRTVPGSFMKRSWLVVGASHAPIVADCAGGTEDPVPIYLLDGMLGEDADVPRAPSFGQMVAGWIEVIETGAWQWNSDPPHWIRDFNALSRDAIATHLY